MEQALIPGTIIYGNDGRRFRLRTHARVRITASIITSIPPELVLEILYYAKSKDLLRLCQIKQLLQRYCRDEKFWKRKTNIDYGVETKPASRSWHSVYIDITRGKTVPVVAFPVIGSLQPSRREYVVKTTYAMSYEELITSIDSTYIQLTNRRLPVPRTYYAITSTHAYILSTSEEWKYVYLDIEQIRVIVWKGHSEPIVGFIFLISLDGKGEYIPYTRSWKFSDLMADIKFVLGHEDVTFPELAQIQEDLPFTEILSRNNITSKALPKLYPLTRALERKKDGH